MKRQNFLERTFLIGALIKKVVLAGQWAFTSGPSLISFLNPIFSVLVLLFGTNEGHFLFTYGTCIGFFFERLFLKGFYSFRNIKEIHEPAPYFSHEKIDDRIANFYSNNGHFTSSKGEVVGGFGGFRRLNPIALIINPKTVVNAGIGKKVNPALSKSVAKSIVGSNPTTGTKLGAA